MNEWIEWSGGDKAPEDVGTYFSVRLRDGKVFDHCANVIPDASWKHVFGKADIVSYKVISKANGDKDE